MIARRHLPSISCLIKLTSLLLIAPFGNVVFFYIPFTSRRSFHACHQRAPSTRHAPSDCTEAAAFLEALLNALDQEAPVGPFVPLAFRVLAPVKAGLPSCLMTSSSRQKGFEGHMAVDVVVGYGKILCCSTLYALV